MKKKLMTMAMASLLMYAPAAMAASCCGANKAEEKTLCACCKCEKCSCDDCKCCTCADCTCAAKAE